MPALITFNELAAQLGVSRSSVARAVADTGTPSRLAIIDGSSRKARAVDIADLRAVAEYIYDRSRIAPELARCAIERLGLPQAEIANRLDVHESTVFNWAIGERRMKRIDYEKLVGLEEVK